MNSLDLFTDYAAQEARNKPKKQAVLEAGRNVMQTDGARISKRSTGRTRS